MSSKINAVLPDTAVPVDQLVIIEIAADGRPINETYRVISVDVSLVADAMAIASFNILDGGPDGCVVANAPELLPGKTVEISIGYEGNLVKVFSGVIVTQSLNISGTQGAVLTIACESPGIIAADKTKAAPVLTFIYQTNIIDLATDLRHATNNGLSVKGNISFQGSAAVVPGNNIQIQGVANNINGAHNVICVYHALSDGNWITSATFGED